MPYINKYEQHLTLRNVFIITGSKETNVKKLYFLKKSFIILPITPTVFIRISVTGNPVFAGKCVLAVFCGHSKNPCN